MRKEFGGTRQGEHLGLPVLGVHLALSASLIQKTAVKPAIPLTHHFVLRPHMHPLLEKRFDLEVKVLFFK